MMFELSHLFVQEKVGLGWIAAKALVHLSYKRAAKNGLLSLSDLNYHALDSIEHDASLSRLDTALSDNQQDKLSQQRFNQFLSFSKDGKSLTTDDVAAARVHFVADSKAHNPQVLWNKDIEKRAWAEASVLLNILGKHGTISIEDAKLFFEKEIFPPGWQKHPSFGILELLSAIKALQNAAHEHEAQQGVQHEDS